MSSPVPHSRSPWSRRAVLAVGLALGAFALPVAPDVRPADPPLPELEPIYRVRASAYGLAFEAASNGCTSRDDFRFYVERVGAEARLAFARRRLDRCRAPGRAPLWFSWSELGIAEGTAVRLLNPVEGA